jgi:hypothetical protein
MQVIRRIELPGETLVKINPEGTRGVTAQAIRLAIAEQLEELNPHTFFRAKLAQAALKNDGVITVDLKDLWPQLEAKAEELRSKGVTVGTTPTGLVRVCVLKQFVNRKKDKQNGSKNRNEGARIK